MKQAVNMGSDKRVSFAGICTAVMRKLRAELKRMLYSLNSLKGVIEGIL